ncbi:YicC/YloC family endoribonuclease [Nereida sp. MMG025]|uniref:YicC/YloC family endoribonuclease n=1 Tax=Nereida sp. MMG025 TaxID=2909981 RepID=UPI001F3C519B|nr:YicC/YloC family endoribonuclease [Nereida sp. MMG025]MCF6443318.1 YicC family protein [Nereida sp. MMG025]
MPQVTRHSMTGFANASGAAGDITWTWDMRAVNGKSLDVRLRVPDWMTGLEDGARKKVAAAMARGNVTLNARVTRDETLAQPRINEAALGAVLKALAHIEQAAMDADVTTVAPSTVEVLAQRGVLETTAADQDTKPLLNAILAHLDEVIAAFNANRAAEGARLAQVVSGQVSTIEKLTADADALQDRRRADMDARFRTALDRVADTAEPERVAQEIAMIAVKADVTEELDRLRAHIAAARDLLATDGPIGRKLDFLSQEFNREANTLCAKAQHAELTAIGLDLKLVIDQMREQIQNLE